MGSARFRAQSARERQAERPQTTGAASWTELYVSALDSGLRRVLDVVLVSKCTIRGPVNGKRVLVSDRWSQLRIRQAA